MSKYLDKNAVQYLWNKMKDYVASHSGGSLSIIDSLTSTSKTSALSANQGKVLDDKKFDKTGGTIKNSTDEWILTVKNGNDITCLHVNQNGMIYDGSDSNLIRGYNNVIGTRVLTGGSLGHYMEITTNNGVFGSDIWQSDKSLKANIKQTEVKDALSKINGIRHVQFNWKDQEGKVVIGYIADELEKILPQSAYNVNQKNGTNIKQINQTVLIPYITKAIQELSSEVSDLEDKVAQLEKQLKGG